MEFYVNKICTNYVSSLNNNSSSNSSSNNNNNNNNNKEQTCLMIDIAIPDN
jgi:hypothetical protein